MEQGVLQRPGHCLVWCLVARIEPLPSDLRDDFFAAVDIGEGVRHYYPRHPGGLSPARCRFVRDVFECGDYDDPKVGEYVADRAGDVGGGNVAVVEALIVAALLHVADAAADLGQLLSEIQSHRSRSGDIESRSACLDGRRCCQQSCESPPVVII